jgi:DNA-binding SARP family transcriptional activator
VTSHRLAVDLWDVDELLSAAARAERAGDGNARARHLDGVLQCWRGEPLGDLGDLDRLDELVPEVQHLRARLVDATLALGEVRLSAGDAPGTEICAERVLSVDPYAERALRLLIAAQVHRGDHRLIDAAVTRALSALQELAVEPQPETSIVLRQARDQLEGVAVGGPNGTHARVRR